MKNVEVAGILERMGELLEITAENAFKVRAYQRAAQAVENLHEPIERALVEGRLLTIPGIGEAISAKIAEILNTGTCRQYEELQESVPAGVVEMLRIPGLGPKKAGLFYRQLGLTSVAELEAAAVAGKLRELAGMGKKTEENILEGISRLKQRSDRLPIGMIRPYAERIAAALSNVGGVERVEVAGSLRRWRETVKDLDLVVAALDPAPVMDAFSKLPEVREVLLRGDTKTSVLTELNVQADLRVVRPGHFASLLNHFTGSRDHNVRLRTIARSRGLSINEYGVFREPDGAPVPIGDDERALYDLLGMSFVIPEMREDTGEVDAALEKRLHVPLEMNDIRCDLHCHTFWSDGTASVDEMAQAAKTRGYTHLGIADHSRSLVVAHGLTLNEIRAQIREIWEWNAKNADSGFCLLAGTECDILGDGTLDWPMDLLSELDCVVASVHTRFKMEEKEMTERVVRALETGRIHVLGHPTGRLLSGRDPYALNMPLVLETARRTGTCVEINAHPDRLDLSDTHARMAKEMGVRLAINSDAHSPEGFGVMEYGVHCARRGWLSAEDVVNTYPLDRLMRVLRKEE